jgi:lipopolysaccharide/colanic/teichoic acid biosynthesis glycosyltransferase
MGFNLAGTSNLSDEVSEFVSLYSGGADSFEVLNTRFPEELAINAQPASAIINLQRVNDIKGINTFFRKINANLTQGGRFAGCMETLENRKDRLLRKYPPVINRCYYAADFLLKRVFPKLRITRELYFILTKGRNRALSKAEVLGRLVYCGFSIEAIKVVDNLMYFVVSKKGEPLKEPEPSNGILLKIARIGKNGKRIEVYKFRTMHPYAQYIQEYVYEQNSLQKGGKFLNDFRITKWGRFMRKFWIDELPMVWNILRGDLKIVGVRPLSEHYLSLYSEEHRRVRIQGKPGLIPPFYADMPEDIEEIMESEARYLRAYLKDPLTTDFNYGFRAFNNILLKKARSA